MVNNIAIKICGINDSETARACKNVDYVGLVFYQKSPRFVTAFQAKEISKFFSKNTKKVGLFVNANIELIEYITEYVNLDFIQLHGDEDLSMIKAIHMVKKIDYYCFSFKDFDNEMDVKYENIPHLCSKFNLKKNLIKPYYLS